MGFYILDLMINTLRLQTLQKICKSYQPNLSINYLMNELAFHNENQTKKFLLKSGCIINEIINNENNQKEYYIITKESIIDMSMDFDD